MPTVQFEQLQEQSETLAGFLDHPVACLRHLDNLLELYAQRNKQKSKAASRSIALRKFEVPQAVLRRITLDLGEAVRDNPRAGLVLLDMLWAKNTFEHRLLAIRLLGKHPKSVLKGVQPRLVNWAEQNREESLLKQLATRATEEMRTQEPSSLLSLSAELLQKHEPRQQAVGLLALKALVDESAVANLPEIFKLLELLLKKPSKSLRPYLLDLYRSLAVQSPGEALFFLKDHLNKTPTEDGRWLARQSLHFFAPVMRNELVNLLAEPEKGSR